MEGGSAAVLAFCIAQILVFSSVSGQGQDSILTAVQSPDNGTLHNDTAPQGRHNNSLPGEPKPKDTKDTTMNLTWIQKLIYEARYNVSHQQHQEPRLEYLDFLPEQEPTPVTPEPEAYNSHYSGNFLVWVCVLGAGCFVCGMLLSSIIALAVYRRQRRRWRRHVGYKNQSGAADVEHNKCLHSDPHGEYFRYKEGLVSDDMKNALSFVFNKDGPPGRSLFQRLNSQTSEATPLYDTLSTYKGQTNPFVNQFSGFLTRDGGTISSLLSDVSMWVNEGCLPRGSIQQFFLNVALDGDQFGVKQNPLEVQLSPIVEMLSPGLKKIKPRKGLKHPVGVWLPHRARLIDVPRRTDWKLLVRYSECPLGEDMVWKDLPEVDNAAESDLNMCWQWARDSVIVNTNRCVTLVCLGERQGDFCPLKLWSFVYASVKTAEHDNRVFQPCLRLYICDDYADGRRRVEQLEYKHRGRCVGESAVYIHQEDTEITLLSAEDPSWPWQPTDSTKKIISWDSFYQCCGAPPAVEFRCTPRDGAVPAPTSIQVTLGLGSLRKDPFHIKTNLVPINELLERSHHQSRGITTVTESHDV